MLLFPVELLVDICF